MGVKQIFGNPGIEEFLQGIEDVAFEFAFAFLVDIVFFCTILM